MVRVCMIMIILGMMTEAQTVRPVRDDVGFCWDARQMERLVSYLAKHEETTAPAGSLVAGISPHDDYLYAARVYYPLYRKLRAKEVVVFGVTHGTVRRKIGDPKGIVILDDFARWTGVAKPVEISPLREYIKARLDSGYFRVDDTAHVYEHSIEALVPFVQYFNPDFRLTPIMVTAMPFEKMDEIAEALSRIIAGYMREQRLAPGKDIVFLMSCDANHYGRDFNNAPFGEDAEAHRKATEQDVRIVRSYLTGPMTEDMIRKLTRDMKRVLWCGRYSVPFGMLTAIKTIREVAGKKLNGTLLRYSDTYTEGVLPLKGTGMGTTAPFSLKHWVGFFSAGYFVE